MFVRILPYLILACIAVLAMGACAETEGTTRENPFPVGTRGDIQFSEDDHWAITVLSTQPDATAIVLEEDNQFNQPPADGWQFYIVTVRATYLGTGSAEFGGLNRVRALGDAGRVYLTSCAVLNYLPNPELFINGTIEGSLCFEVLSSDEDSLLLIVDADAGLFSFDLFAAAQETVRAWFQLPR